MYFIQTNIYIVMNLRILFLAIFVLEKDHLISASFLPHTNLVRQLGGLAECTDGGGINGGKVIPCTGGNAVPSPAQAARPGETVDFTVTNEMNGGSGEGTSGTIVRAPPPPPDGTSLIIRRGIDCGFVEVNGGDVIEISSRNYPRSNYFNNEACTWIFQGNRCTLSALCPCVDFPASPFCLEDYLRITDKYNFDQRYCGGNSPGRPLISNSDSLTIRYRTDKRITATGFACYVSCAPPGVGTILSIMDTTPCPNAPK